MNARIREVLEDRDELPGGLCEDCARASVLNWASSFPIFTPGFHDPLYLPLDVGRYAYWDRNPSSPILAYPKSLVTLVVRQWVEEKIEDEKKFLRQHAVAAAHCISLVRQTLPLEHGEAVNLLEDIRPLLVGSGLPATPGTARWLLAKVQPDHPLTTEDAMPTRGTLVTSIALSPNAAHIRELGRVVGEMLHFLTWASPWSNEPLARRAEKCSRTHADWWRKKAGIMPEVTLSGRPHGGASPEMEVDMVRHHAGEMTKEM